MTVWPSRADSCSIGMGGTGGITTWSNGSRFSSSYAGVGGIVLSWWDWKLLLKAELLMAEGMLVGHPALTLLRTYVGVRYTGGGPLIDPLD